MDTNLYHFLMTATRSELKKFRSIVRALSQIGMGTESDMEMVVSRLMVERNNRQNNRIRQAVDEKSYR